MRDCWLLEGAENMSKNTLPASQGLALQGENLSLKAGKFLSIQPQPKHIRLEAGLIKTWKTPYEGGWALHSAQDPNWPSQQPVLGTKNSQRI